PDSDWATVEYPLAGSENVARATLPTNVRPDSVWMIAAYGYTLLLFIRGPMGDWTHDTIAPPDVNVGSADMAAAVDAFGRWHVVIVSELFGGGYDLHYGMYSNSGMQWQRLNAPLGPYGSGAAPELVAEDSGRVHIFYRVLAWGYIINHTWNDGPGGHTWQTESLGNTNFDNYTTKAIWSREYGLCAAISGNDGFGFPGRIYYHRKPLESCWLTPELATGTHSAVNGQLALDSFGNPMIVWEQTSGNILTGNIYYAMYDQQWENYPLFLNSISYYPQVVMDSQDRGNLIYAMDYYPDDEEIYFFGPEPQSVAPPIDTSPLPNSPVLHPLYPNPMNATCTIKFTLPSVQRARLGIYNILGQEIQVLASGMHEPGVHYCLLDAATLASGWYVVLLETPRYRQMQPLSILK
ncbi:hypothetical protein AMJ86_06070, partial [bacterium SM23_57]